MPFAFGSQFELVVDVSALIEEIVITPFAAVWQVSGIKGAIEALLKEVGAGQIAVRQSKHMRVPEIGWPPETKTRNEVLFKAIEQSALSTGAIGKPLA